MTSQSKPPTEPVGIELLLDLLNASEDLVARKAVPQDVSDPLSEASSLFAREPLPPGAATTQTVEVVDADIADVETPADLAEIDVSVDEVDGVENRFAAHVVRGMSKSKNKRDG